MYTPQQKKPFTTPMNTMLVHAFPRSSFNSDPTPHDAVPLSFS